jgi:hypothetical protein
MAENPPLALEPTPLPGFQTTMAQPWLGGVQLNKPITDIAITEAARLANWVHTGGDLEVRPGLTAYLTSGGGSVNAIRRLTDPVNGLTRIYFGAGSSWYRCDEGFGIAELLEAGFSGDPLTMVPIRKPQESGSWLLVADRAKMRKVGLAVTSSRPIGVAAPGTAANVVLGTKFTCPAAAFEVADGTQAANWSKFAGADNDGVAFGAAGSVADVAGTLGSAVAFTVVPGGATGGFRSSFVIAKALDLSTFTAPSAGPTISDDDLLHLQLRMSDPTNVQEVRLYFVCSPISLTGSIPGTHPTENTAAYLHAFQPSDYESFIGVLQSAAGAAQVGAGSSIIGGTPLLEGRLRNDTSPTNADRSRPVPRAGQPVTQAASGANTWVEFSQTGLPLRRSDFVKIGTAGIAGTDWSTVTGLYVVVWTRINRGLTVSFDDAYWMGGAGPDTSEPGLQKYDYRYINHDTQTGARSNGSLTMADSAAIDASRQAIVVTPAPSGNAFMRQEVFRRGGTITDNWYFVGENTSDGGVFTDTLTDAAIAASDTLPTENFQPVPTVDGNGITILAQPVPILFGPIGDGVYCALGDPHRPGHVYSCLAGDFDAWPSTGGYAVEVCSPSEELMNGCVLGGGGFVLSRERGYLVYTNPGGLGILYSPTGVTPGLAARWGFCVGPGGIFYVAKDGVRVTSGQDSQVLSDALRPLFNGETVSGRLPIDFSQPNEIRLAYHNNDLWFCYKDTGGTRQKAVFSLLYRYWRFVDFQSDVTGACYSDESENVQTALGPNRLLVGTPSGTVIRHEGFSDLGLAIPASLRTGAWTFGTPRSDKLLGDMVADVDLKGVVAVVRTYFNAETVISGNLTIPASTGRAFFPLQPFGPEPERARSLSLEFSLVAPITARPLLYGLGAATITEPEVTLQRVTAWEPLPGGEAYLEGVRIDCDTFGAVKTVLVEVDLAGTYVLAATLSIQTSLGGGPSTRHTQWFSWPAVHAHQVRLRPTDEHPWTLWRCEWLSQPEPARIVVWDTNWESPGGDRYYTGLDLECDTFGQAKLIAVYVDQVNLGTFPVLASGRRYLHITLPPGRGHLFRFVATDSNPGLLYNHEWLTTEEPREQANWNAGFTTWNSLSDKYLKGLIIEADTFNLVKTVEVQVDGVTLHTISVQHDGRSVKNYTFPQVLGRVFRVIPSDGFASRPYTILPIFDEEPYALSRWESQLLDFNLPGAGWGSILSADLCYRSTVGAILTITGYNSQGVLVTTITQAILSTGGAKQKVYLPFAANKGVLFKLVFQTGDDSPGLTIYQEESRLRVQTWAGQEQAYKPFGNDDLDATRNMTRATAAAARSGGGS